VRSHVGLNKKGLREMQNYKPMSRIANKYCALIAVQTCSEPVPQSNTQKSAAAMSRRNNIPHYEIGYRYLKNLKVLLHYACEKNGTVFFG